MHRERRRSFAQTWGERLTPLRNYFLQTDLHGYKFLAESNRVLLERVIWTAVILGFTFGSAYTIASNLANYFEAPTAISEIPSKRKVDEITFPAVSICMANRFSKRKTMKFAEFIFAKQKELNFEFGTSVEEIHEEIKILVHLIDFSAPQDSAGLAKLHNTLRLIFNGTYPIRQILAEIQVPCSDILVFCAWLDKEVNCSEVFESRRSYAGDCCIFNYIRPSIEELARALELEEAPYVRKARTTFSNAELKFPGLSVVVDYTPEDDVITLTNTFDTCIQIFNNKDFPDVTNGAIREAFVAMGTQSYIQLFPKYVRADAELRSVHSSIRNCVFDDEVTVVHKSYYTYGECILACRLSDIIRMCGCTPPSMTVLHNATYCDLADLLCLIRFHEKWINSDTNTYDYTILNPNCVDCYPTCDYLRYEIETTATVIREVSYIDVFGRDRPPVRVDPSRQSIIHIYYGDKFVKEFEQKMISTWYDLLSSLGGIVALITGGSLISIMEVLYLITGRFGATIIKKCFRRIQKQRERKLRQLRKELIGDIDGDSMTEENSTRSASPLAPKLQLEFVN